MNTYYLIASLIHPILILLVFTTTTEKSFLEIRIIKTKLHNKIDDEFLTDYMMFYI